MDLATIAQFGPTGLAIVTFYGIYKLFDQERKRSEERLDAAYNKMSVLEGDIRNKFAAQLMENTNAIEENTQTMNKVLTSLPK
jgi:hypothetical protein